MQKPVWRALKAAAVTTTTAGLMITGIGAASAHVSVSPASTEAGGYSQLTFSVPNESETANTNKLEIELPTETPFTSVRVKPVEGWTAEVIESELPEPATVGGTTITEAPTTVVWTADDEDHQISQDEFQTFSLSVGRLPSADTMVILPVAQSYTDGSVSNWDDAPAEGEAEPQSPAPSFVTTAATEGGHGAAEAVSPEEAPATAAAAQEPAAAATADAPGQTVGWIGLGAGLLGLIAGVLALARTRGAHTK